MKEFHGSESSSWRQEKAVLASPLYQSSHVIKLLSSELRCENGKKKMWLVLPYYHNGDLQQFLKRNVIDLEKMIRISHSICLAVDFIHAETDSFGCQRLPLAHRDIKVRISLNQVLAKLTKHIYIFHIFTIYCTGDNPLFKKIRARICRY